MGTFTSFGQTIPVTGAQKGYPGTLSRMSPPPVISARPVLASAAHPLYFGEPAMLVADSTNQFGASYVSLRDYLATAANVVSVATDFAGFAKREVKQAITYPSNVTPGVQTVSYYQQGEMAEVIELGSLTVQVTHGTPAVKGVVYGRIAANSALVGTAVGGVEAAADTSVITASTSGASTTVTPVSMTGIVAGQLITGTGIPAGTYVVSVGVSTIVVSQSINLSGVAVTFANTVVLPHVLFRGPADSDGMAEVTFTQRNTV